MVESDIHLLELADGIKDTLISSGFSTIKSVLESTTSDLSTKIGVDQYVAQIIFEEARSRFHLYSMIAPLLYQRSQLRRKKFYSYLKLFSFSNYSF
jgi:hypothetical protein